MITNEEFNSLGEFVRKPIPGATLVEEVQITILFAILDELRSLRVSNEQLSSQFNKVSAGGNSLFTESAL